MVLLVGTDTAKHHEYIQINKKDWIVVMAVGLLVVVTWGFGPSEALYIDTAIVLIIKWP